MNAANPLDTLPTETLPVIEHTDRDALVAASGDDVYVRCSAPDPADGWARTWSLAGSNAVAWYGRPPRRGGAGWLAVTGDGPDAAALTRALLGVVPGAVDGMTIPAAARPLLAVDQQPVAPNLWDWFWTATEPPEQPLEHLVRWATPDDEPAIAALLDRDSPRHSARPGDSDVIRWCVLADSSVEKADTLLACAAETHHRPGVPHLASIATRTDARGRGLGGSITAWLTRAILREGADVVTLGMYADNDAARRVYRRLGYTDLHHFASGPLATSSLAEQQADADCECA